MTDLSLNDDDRLALAAAEVVVHPDGSLRSARSGSIVAAGVAASLLSRGDSFGKAQNQPVVSGISPDGIHRGYIAAGHAADSPANRRLAAPVPPEGGGRSSSLCTTPDPDDDGTADGGGVEKVVEAAAFHGGPLITGHAAPSPGDAGDNNPVPPVTGSGTVYEPAAGIYDANVARERAQHVEPSQCITSTPAPARLVLPPDLGARNVPQPRAAGATRKAPGE